MNETAKTIAGVFIMVLVVAIVAVLVSQRANTQGVIQSTGSAFAGAIQAAVSPLGASSPGAFGGAAIGG